MYSACRTSRRARLNVNELGAKIVPAALLQALDLDGDGAADDVRIIGDSQNTSSVRVHEKAGFQHSGVLRDVGFKFDRWLDTVFMQLPL